MPDTKEATDRILERFQAKNISLDRAMIERDIDRFVKEFGMPLSEAERAITAREAKSKGVTIYEGSKSSGGTTVRDIATLKPEEWASVIAKVVSLSEPQSKSIHQTGILADRSGYIRFTAWARKKGSTKLLMDMKVGSWYKISNTVVDTYAGAPSLSIHSGSDISDAGDHGDIKPVVTKISDLKPGVVTVRGKVTKMFQPNSDKIFQTGLIGDETGVTKFTSWKSNANHAPMEEGKSYMLEFANAVEYKGNNNLVIGSIVKPLSEDITVKASSSSFRGNIVQIRPGSGLIRRCPVEGCGRVLSRQNYCPNHEIQKDFVYDLRVKAVVDDGEKARNIHIPAAIVEKSCGIKIKDAIKTAETSALGFDDVLSAIRDKLLGRYFVVEGTPYPDRIYVTNLTPLKMERDKASALLREASV